MHINLGEVKGVPAATHFRAEAIGGPKRPMLRLDRKRSLITVEDGA